MGATHTFYSHHSIIEQKALEHIRVSKLVGRERTLHPTIGKSILGYFQKHALAVALYLVKTYNAVEFGIVGLGVGVEFVRRFPSVIEETTQIIKHHISIEHMVVLDISVF